MTVFMPAVKVSDEPSNFQEPRLNDKKKSAFFHDYLLRRVPSCPTGVLELYDAWQILMWTKGALIRRWSRHALHLLGVFFSLHGLIGGFEQIKILPGAD